MSIIECVNFFFPLERFPADFTHRTLPGFPYDIETYQNKIKEERQGHRVCQKELCCVKSMFKHIGILMGFKIISFKKKGSRGP